MRKYSFFFLTSTLLLMSQTVYASSMNDDDNRDIPPLATQKTSTQNLQVNPEKDQLIKTLGEQTGDLALFLEDQRSTFESLSDMKLRTAIKSFYYKETLSPNTPHGKTYREIGKNSIVLRKPGLKELNLKSKNLRLVPLNFEGVEELTHFSLEDNQLIVLPNLSRLTALKELNLMGNKSLDQVDVTNIPHLKLVLLPEHF